MKCPKGGDKMEKFYTYLSSIYRFLVIGVFIYLHMKTAETMETRDVIMYAVFVVFVIIFILLRINKWSAYLELIVIGSMIYIYQESSLYYLFLMPVINFASAEAKKYETILFSLLLSGFIYTQLEHTWFFIFSFVGIAATLLLFQSKFNQIEMLETKLYKERTTFQEARKTLADREMELENVLKMFMKSKELNEVFQEERLMEILVESAKEFFNAHYASLFLMQDGQFEKFLETGKTEKYTSVNTLPSNEVDTDIIKGEMLQVIIYYQGNPWGALRVYGKTSTIGERKQKIFFPFSELDHELLLTYVDQVMIKLKEVQLLKKNEFLANYDFLTGVPNRRYFIDRFEQFEAMASRGENFSVLLMDIDHFKKFNDKYGHDTGDTVLRIVAETLQEAIRDKYDVVGRLGGEEFGILLLNPNEQTFLVADRIRRMISVVPAVEQITMSIGIAYYGVDGTSWEELYNNADKALYHAKENGRNQVIEHRNI